ncbi:hypothetical protein AOLI_G00142460 [Acnodon oligacanthus]
MALSMDQLCCSVRLFLPVAFAPKQPFSFFSLFLGFADKRPAVTHHIAHLDTHEWTQDGRPTEDARSRERDRRARNVIQTQQCPQTMTSSLLKDAGEPNARSLQGFRVGKPQLNRGN